MAVSNVQCSFHSLSSFHQYYFLERLFAAVLPFCQDGCFSSAISLWGFGGNWERILKQVSVFTNASSHTRAFPVTYAKNGVAENFWGVPNVYITMGTCFRNVIISRGAARWLILAVVIHAPLPVSVGFSKWFLQSAGIPVCTNHRLLLFEIVQKPHEISMNVSSWRSFMSTQLFFCASWYRKVHLVKV